MPDPTKEDLKAAEDAIAAMCGRSSNCYCRCGYCLSSTKRSPGIVAQAIATARQEGYADGVAQGARWSEGPIREILNGLDTFVNYNNCETWNECWPECADAARDAGKEALEAIRALPRPTGDSLREKADYQCGECGCLLRAYSPADGYCPNCSGLELTEAEKAALAAYNTPAGGPYPDYAGKRFGRPNNTPTEENGEG
jgi:hypothetical protein